MKSQDNASGGATSISLNETSTYGDQGPLSMSYAIAGGDPRAAEAVAEAAAEAALFARIADGEPAAIDRIYRLHHAALRGFANRFVGDPTAAEDLVHDVFVALPSAIRRFRGDSSLRTFLIAIAVNRGYKHLRSASRRRAAMARLVDEPLATAPRPDTALAQQRLAHDLYAALDRLPKDQRTAFVLCEIDQMTAGEAASIVGAPEATMRTRLFHARKKLRELLADHEEACR